MEIRCVDEGIESSFASGVVEWADAPPRTFRFRYDELLEGETGANLSETLDEAAARERLRPLPPHAAFELHIAAFAQRLPVDVFGGDLWWPATLERQPGGGWGARLDGLGRAVRPCTPTPRSRPNK